MQNAPRARADGGGCIGQVGDDRINGGRDASGHRFSCIPGSRSRGTAALTTRRPHCLFQAQHRQPSRIASTIALHFLCRLKKCISGFRGPPRSSKDVSIKRPRTSRNGWRNARTNGAGNAIGRALPCGCSLNTLSFIFQSIGIRSGAYRRKELRAGARLLRTRRQ